VDRTEKGTRYYRSVIYPDIPVTADDIYVITTGGDRYDTLAQQFYGDSSLWWVIATANNSKKDSLVVAQGIQLRIPNDPGAARRSFDDVNRTR
jgi:hypothetical protein